MQGLSGGLTALIVRPDPLPFSLLRPHQALPLLGGPTCVLIDLTLVLIPDQGKLTLVLILQPLLLIIEALTHISQLSGLLLPQLLLLSGPDMYQLLIELGDQRILLLQQRKIAVILCSQIIQGMLIDLSQIRGSLLGHLPHSSPGLI
jgi:hypothetical protein